MNPANPFDQGTQAPLSLLQDFAQDADLRARLEADPVATFAEFGIQVKGHNSAASVALEDEESILETITRWLGIF